MQRQAVEDEHTGIAVVEALGQNFIGVQAKGAVEGERVGHGAVEEGNLCCRHLALIAQLQGKDAALQGGVTSADLGKGTPFGLLALEIGARRFRDGAEALDCLKRHSVSLVVTDLKMPGGDGMEVLRRARTLNEQTLVIIMTAFGTVDGAVEAIKEGLAQDSVSVIIARRECALIAKRDEKGAIIRKHFVDQESCKKCRTCVTKFQCPAISSIDKVQTIDGTLCAGCGVCAQVCPYKAIKEVQ